MTTQTIDQQREAYRKLVTVRMAKEETALVDGGRVMRVLSNLIRETSFLNVLKCLANVCDDHYNQRHGDHWGVWSQIIDWTVTTVERCR